MLLLASPMIVLSGYAAPVENMPVVLEFVGRADPIRWMLLVSRGLFLQAIPAGFALQLAAPLLGIAFTTFLAAWFAVRRPVT